MKISDAYIFGKTVNKKSAWTARDISRITAEAARRKPAMRAVLLDEIISALDAAGKLFKKGKWRAAAFAHLKKHISFSDEMINLSLDLIPELLERETLLKRMRLELFLPEALDGCAVRPGYDGLVTAVPKGVALHVGAGNVFLGILDSLLLGILTRNVNIVKTASGGSKFMVLFLQALKSCDPKGALSGSVAVLSWPGGVRELEETVVRGSDAVFVWGGEEAALAYKRMAPVNTHVVGFGPKMSAALVTETALKNIPLRQIASDIARDVSLWDQSACASPHTLFFVCPDKRRWTALKQEFSHEIALAFKTQQRLIPQGKLSPDEQVEITKARQLAKIDAAVGKASQVSPFPKTDWTVIIEETPDFKPSPLNRVLYVKRANSVVEVAGRLARYKGYIQTLGVAGTAEERAETAGLFAPLGVARITRLGKMLEGPVGSPHDGTFPMRELVNFVGVEGAASAEETVCELAEFARENSPFYRRHYRGVGGVEAMPDFEKLPLLDKTDILANTPPENFDMFTGPIQQGVYFASGGSTGNPKYIFFNNVEYDNVCRNLALCFENAGLGVTDRAANLFVSGNLWSSWLSVEKALAHTQAVSVPIGSALPMDSILKYLAEFKVTAIIGLPSFLIKVAEAVEAARLKLPIRFVFYGGEYVGPKTAAYFGKVFPGVAVRSAGYATVDAGVIGYQCPHCRAGEHHLFSGEQYIEILDTDTLKPVQGSETGELVTTVLNKRHMPVIRFRAGDLARWLPGICRCGRRDRKFEILGRCDDRIHIGGAHIFVNDLQNAIAEVPGLSLNFQVKLIRMGHREKIIILAETKSPIPAAKAAALKPKLLAAIKKNCEDFTYVLDRDWMEPPDIEIIAPGALPRLPRTGKIKRVIDLRIQA